MFYLLLLVAKWCITIHLNIKFLVFFQLDYIAVCTILKLEGAIYIHFKQYCHEVFWSFFPTKRAAISKWYGKNSDKIETQTENSQTN